MKFKDYWKLMEARAEYVPLPSKTFNTGENTIITTKPKPPWFRGDYGADEMVVFQGDNIFPQYQPPKKKLGKKKKK